MSEYAHLALFNSPQLTAPAIPVVPRASSERTIPINALRPTVRGMVGIDGYRVRLHGQKLAQK